LSEMLICYAESGRFDPAMANGPSTKGAAESETVLTQ
jgi:hypothetical protein